LASHPLLLNQSLPVKEIDREKGAGRAKVPIKPTTHLASFSSSSLFSLFFVCIKVCFYKLLAVAASFLSLFG